jgi:hypothetical protein
MLPMPVLCPGSNKTGLISIINKIDIRGIIHIMLITLSAWVSKRYNTYNAYYLVCLGEGRRGKGEGGGQDPGGRGEDRP